MSLHCDFDEGRACVIGCLTCRDDVRAVLGFAHPVRYYMAALVCPCGAEIVEFEI